MYFLFWHKTTQEWDGFRKTESTYDSNNNLIRCIQYKADKASSGYLLNFKHEYTYDSRGNKLDSIQYKWDDVNNMWIIGAGYLKVSFTYSADNHRINSTDCRYNAATSSWDNVLNTHYYYDGITSAPTNRAEELAAYPNPVSDLITFSLSDHQTPVIFELIDSRGQRIMTTEVHDAETFDLNGIANGFYLYNLLFDDKIQSGKIVKE